MTLSKLSALVALCVAAPLSFAQTTTSPADNPRTAPAEVMSSPSATPMPSDTTTPMPSDTVTPPAQPQPQQVIVLPEKVVETSVDLTTGGPQSPQSARDARIEAVNSLGEVRAECRRENRGGAALNACLQKAQADYNAVLARTSGRH